MKIFLLFVFLFFSSESFSMVICINDSSADSCLEDGDSNGGSTEGVNCYYDKNLGVTQCNTVLGDGSIAGYWDEKTFTCSNLVAPVVDAAGYITCPPTTPVTIKSTTAPNPSKDDEGCNPSDPNNTVDCASQDTLIKTNDLISESNSKLGAISGGTAANTGLLKEISGTLKAIAGQGAPGSGSSGSEGEVDCSLFPNDSSCIVKKPISTLSPSLSSSGSSCPAPESFSVLSGNYEFSYQPVCDFLDSIRGLVVAMGALSALLIVVTAL